MSLEERCGQLEARLQAIQSSLCPPHPDQWERCEAELRDVICSLADCTVDRQSTVEYRVRAKMALLQLKRATHRLKAQLEHGLNLCQGLAQLRMGAGYTEQGRPVLAGAETGASYEA